MFDNPAKLRPKIKIEEIDGDKKNLNWQFKDDLNEQGKKVSGNEANHDFANQQYMVEKKNIFSSATFACLDKELQASGLDLAKDKEIKDKNVNQVDQTFQTEECSSKDTLQNLTNPDQSLRVKLDAGLGSQTENITSEDVKRWLEEVKPDTTKCSNGSFSWGKLFFVILFFLALGALMGGIYFYQSSVSSFKEDSVMPSFSPTTVLIEEDNKKSVKETPTPTPQSELSLSKFSVLVKNGTGIPGEAGKASLLLQTIGFSKPDTGNASNFNFKDTEVTMKSSVPESVFELIKSTLEKNYVSVVKSSQALSSGQSYDIVITVGKKID